MSTDATARSFVPNILNRTDGVAIEVYPYRKDSFPVANVCTEITWREDTERASVEAEITLHDPDGYLRDNIPPGTWILVRVVDPITETWTDPPLNLYVWERAAADRNQSSIRLVCFDVISILNRTGVRPDWVFRKSDARKKGWTAYEIAKRVLEDTDIKFRIPQTTHYIKYMHLQNASPMEVITAAYTEDRINTGRRYRIRAISRWLIIEPLIAQPYTWELVEGTNLVSASYSESLAGLATEVRAVVVNEDTRVQTRQARAYSNDIGRYGRLTKTVQYTQDQTPKELKELAVKQLKLRRKLGKTATVTAEGIPTLRATDAVVIRESGTGLNGRLFVDSVQHSITPGRHQMTIELSETAKVPTRRLSESEKEPPPTPASGTAVVIGPDGQPVVVDPNLTNADYPELATITDNGPDEIARVTLDGVKPNVRKWAEDLMRAVPGNQYVTSAYADRIGSTVAGSGRPSRHGFGFAVDISAADLQYSGRFDHTGGSPSLTLIARLARESLGGAHTQPPVRRSDDVRSSADTPQDGTTSDSRGTVIWRTREGGDHYNHVHIDLKSESITPVVPVPTAAPASPPADDGGASGDGPGAGTPGGVPAEQTPLERSVVPRNATTRPTFGRRISFQNFNSAGINAACRYARAAGDPIAFITTARIESQYNPSAQDEGRLYGGLFQLDIPGSGANPGRAASYNMTRAAVFDPWANAKASADEFRTFYNQGFRGAELALRAQRPNPGVHGIWRSTYFPQWQQDSIAIWRAAMNAGY